LASDEEEVEDLRAMEKIEEIMRMTYERKKRGPREGIEGNTVRKIGPWSNKIKQMRKQNT
jgi:hypothetical protein